MAGSEVIAVERMRLPKTSKFKSAVYGGFLGDPRALGGCWKDKEENPGGPVPRRGRKKKIGTGWKTPKLPPLDLGFRVIADGG